MIAKLVESIPYALPDVMSSWDDLERFYHRDLPTLSNLELWAEERRVQDALAAAVIAHEESFLYSPNGRSVRVVDWLHERLEAVAAEKESRRRCG